MARGLRNEIFFFKYHIGSILTQKPEILVSDISMRYEILEGKDLKS